MTVDTTSSAESALLLMSTGRYDVIVSDFRMPGLDGLALLHESKRLHPDTPVILLTGYGDKELELEDKAAQQGAYAFLHKPFAGNPSSQCDAKCME